MNENKKKRVAISVGPIPARLDSVKFITNKFKGGLAIKTAKALADKNYDLTVVAWAYTANTALNELEQHPNVSEIVRIRDVFEYYDWFVAHARDYDAFVMAAAVANLTPVKPWEGKFPSHNYKPGDEFDIKFMIAPRAIDAIKPLNPRACLIGYKLFDCDDEEELAGIAMHTLSDARANIIFANTPKTAKSGKIAVFPDGTKIKCGFDEHVDLIDRAIRQEYYKTDAAPLSELEASDPDIREALATVSMYEKTFDKYGTVAIPVMGEANKGMFATTSRGHKAGPVLVRGVDTNTIYASGKATLNTPALHALLAKHDFKKIVVHRHFDDPRADQNIAYPTLKDWRLTDPAAYVFPGTKQEVEFVTSAHEAACPEQELLDSVFKNGDVVIEAGHGYLALKPVRPVDWNKYNDLFPSRYMKPVVPILELVHAYRDEHIDVLEIGGNERPVGNFSYDPYVKPDPDFAQPVTWDDLKSRTFPLAVAFNAVNYLSRAELIAILEHCNAFAANTFRHAPDETVRDGECAVRVDNHDADIIRHGLLLPDDGLMRHWFRAYEKSDYEAMGLACLEYGTNSMIVYKGNIDAALTLHMGGEA